MKTNFKIERNYALRYGDRLLDLHNNFDITRFQYDPGAKEFRFWWTRKNGDWVKDDEVANMELVHKSVSYLSIGDKDERGRLEDDDSLDDLTFYPSTHRNENDSVVDKSNSDDGDDILYNLQSGRTVRVCCETIELHLR
jgi:hypothetical protein